MRNVVQWIQIRCVTPVDDLFFEHNQTKGLRVLVQKLLQISSWCWIQNLPLMTLDDRTLDGEHICIIIVFQVLANIAQAQLIELVDPRGEGIDIVEHIAYESVCLVDVHRAVSEPEYANVLIWNNIFSCWVRQVSAPWQWSVWNGHICSVVAEVPDVHEKVVRSIQGAIIEAGDQGRVTADEYLIRYCIVGEWYLWEQILWKDGEQRGVEACVYGRTTLGWVPQYFSMPLIRERIVAYPDLTCRVARDVLVHGDLWTLWLKHVVWWKKFVNIAIILLEVAIEESNSVVREGALLNPGALTRLAYENRRSSLDVAEGIGVLFQTHYLLVLQQWPSIIEHEHTFKHCDVPIVVQVDSAFHMGILNV